MKIHTLLPFVALAFAVATPLHLTAAPDGKKKPRPEKQKKEALPRPDKPAPPEPSAKKKRSTTNAETRPFLGVATSPVAPSVREYLDLDEGFGIQLQQILPDSPAAEADLKKHDILVKFEDQLLISPEHLSLLVRTRSGNDSVDLTVIRKGKELNVSVKLSEKEESFFSPRIERYRTPGGPPHSRHWQEHFKRQQDHWKKGWVPNSPGEKAAIADTPGLEGKPPAVSVRPGFPVSVFGTEGIMKIDNHEGEVTITEEDGKHRIEIEDAKGHLIHKGEFDPESGIEALPKAARDHLEKMKLENLEVLTPPPSKPEKTSAPPAKAEKDSSEEEIL